MKILDIFCQKDHFSKKPSNRFRKLILQISKVQFLSRKQGKLGLMRLSTFELYQKTQQNWMKIIIKSFEKIVEFEEKFTLMKL